MELLLSMAGIAVQPYLVFNETLPMITAVYIYLACGMCLAAYFHHVSYDGRTPKMYIGVIFILATFVTPLIAISIILEWLAAKLLTALGWVVVKLFSRRTKASASKRYTMSIDCIKCGTSVETDCPELMKYCDDCWRDIQEELSQPYTPKSEDQLTEIDRIAREVTRECLAELKAEVKEESRTKRN